MIRKSFNGVFWMNVVFLWFIFLISKSGNNALFSIFWNFLLANICGDWRLVFVHLTTTTTTPSSPSVATLKTIRIGRDSRKISTYRMENVDTWLRLNRSLNLNFLKMKKPSNLMYRTLVETKSETPRASQTK